MPEWRHGQVSESRLDHILTRRLFLKAAVISTVELRVPAAANPTDNWANIRQVAEHYVARESPPEVWPFMQPPMAKLLRSQRKVFVDYFTPYPLSFRNEGSTLGVYEKGLLSPSGMNGRFARVGGYIRERPLPVPAWPYGNWRLYNMAIEILRAHRIGADGFIAGMERLPNDPGWLPLQNLYETASNFLDTNFRLIPEPDTTALRAVGATDVGAALAELAHYAAAFRLSNGSMLVSPFKPESYSLDWWRECLSEAKRRGVQLALLPVLLSPLRGAAEFAPISYGLSWWGIRDFGSVGHGTDAAIEDQLTGYGKPFMQPIAPQDVRPKIASFAEAGNTRLFRNLWTEAISRNAQYVHLITWNDYSEGTEIEPSTGIQFLMYDLAAYYIAWFKTGQPPFIVRDAIYYCHRRQFINPIAQAGQVMKVGGSTPVTNNVEMLGFLTAPATLEMTIGGNTYRDQVGAGLQILNVPAAPGRPSFRIIRNDRTVVDLTSDFTIAPEQENCDPLYVGGSSTRLYQFGRKST